MKKLLVLVSLVLAGCTTVSNGPMQRIRVESEPQGAAVALTKCGAMATKTVTTPAVAWVSRRSTQCRLVFRKPYYDEQTIRLSRHTSPRMDGYGTTADVILDTSTSLSDVAILGTAILLPSLVIDAASGSMFELEPNEVLARLVPASQDWRDRKSP
jgi:uncharacterized protein YcfL